MLSRIARSASSVILRPLLRRSAGGRLIALIPDKQVLKVSPWIASRRILQRECSSGVSQDFEALDEKLAINEMKFLKNQEAEDAVKHIVSLADQKHSRAALLASLFTRVGCRSVKQDASASRKYLEEAVAGGDKLAQAWNELQKGNPKAANEKLAGLASTMKDDHLYQLFLGLATPTVAGKEFEDQDNIKLLRQSALQGNPDAQAALGHCYQQTANNVDAARVWYERAAAQGHAEGEMALAILSQTGERNDANLTFEYLSRASARGHDAAIFSLGCCYEEGLGTTIDESKAFALFHESAERGNPDGQVKTGFCYFEGKGIARDPVQAAKWFTLAAEQGHTAAQYNLAMLYEGGEGVEQSTQSAFRWYLRASMAGDDDASMKVAFALHSGIGVGQDIPKAVSILERLAEKGDVKAQALVANAYMMGNGVVKNDARALELYSKAAEQGYADAQAALGAFYSKGMLGLEKNLETSLEWYQRAAHQKHPAAIVRVGNCYELGLGVERDLEKAFRWYERGAVENHDSAIHNLARCYRYGLGVAEDARKGTQLFEEAASLGFAPSQLEIAYTYMRAAGDPNAGTKAVGWLEKAAAQGNLNATSALGVIFLKGLYDVPKDEEKGIALLQQAAHSGHHQSMYHLAFAHLYGQGVKHTETLGMKYLRQAAPHVKDAQDLLLNLEGNQSS